jgi:drug/metabolite transporter (DMT)-like permease
MDSVPQRSAGLQQAPTIAAQLSQEGTRWSVYGQLVLTMFLWGLAWPVGRLLATGLPPVSIAALRYAIVVPVLFAVMWIKRQHVNLRREWIVELVAMGLFSTTLYQIFFLYGVRYAAASDDSLVVGIGPVLIAIMASFVLNEHLTKTKALGFISGLAGIATIAVLSPNTNVPNRLLGITLVFGGAVVYALYTVILRRFVAARHVEGSGPSLSSLGIVAWISLFGWIFLIPFSVLESPWTYTWTVTSWLGIAYLAIMSTIVGFFFYVEGVSKIGAGRAAIFGNLVPVFGVISSALILGETIGRWHGVSFLLIFTGVILINRRRNSSSAENARLSH